MFISSVKAPYTIKTQLGSYKQGTRVTNYGKLPNGNHISIDSFIEDGITHFKRYVIWNSNMQRVINKSRGKKGFERLA